MKHLRVRRRFKIKFGLVVSTAVLFFLTSCLVDYYYKTNVKGPTPKTTGLPGSFVFDDINYSIEGEKNLYLYDSIDGRYYYVIQLAENLDTKCVMDIENDAWRCYGISETFIILHIAGDSTNSLEGDHNIIADEKSFVRIGRDEFLLDSGFVHIASKNDKPVDITFSCKTIDNRYLSGESPIFDIKTSYSLTRNVNGYVKYKGKSFGISKVEVDRAQPDRELGFIMTDYSRKDSVKIHFYFGFDNVLDTIPDGEYVFDNSWSNYYAGNILWIQYFNGNDEKYQFEKGLANFYPNNDSLKFEAKLISAEQDTLFTYWNGPVNYFWSYTGGEY